MLLHNFFRTGASLGSEDRECLSPCRMNVVGIKQKFTNNEQEREITLHTDLVEILNYKPPVDFHANTWHLFLTLTQKTH